MPNRFWTTNAQQCFSCYCQSHQSPYNFTIFYFLHCCLDSPTTLCFTAILNMFTACISHPEMDPALQWTSPNCQYIVPESLWSVNSPQCLRPNIPSHTFQVGTVPVHCSVPVCTREEFLVSCLLLQFLAAQNQACCSGLKQAHMFWVKLKFYASLFLQQVVVIYRVALLVNLCPLYFACWRNNQVNHLKAGW